MLMVFFILVVVYAEWPTLGRRLLYVVLLGGLLFLVYHQRDNIVEVWDVATTPSPTPPPRPASTLVRATTDPTLRVYHYSVENNPGVKVEYGRHPVPKNALRTILMEDSPREMVFRVEFEVTPGKTSHVYFTIEKGGSEKPVGLWVQDEPKTNGLPMFTGKWYLKEKQTIPNGYCLAVWYDRKPEAGWSSAYLEPISHRR